MSNEKLDKTIGQFQLKACELFKPFDKYGYAEMRDGAVSELKFLIRQLKKRLNGENVIIATKKELRQITGENPDD